MSAVRVTKIFEGLAEQFRRQGYPQAFDIHGTRPCIKWIGRAADGRDAVVIDLTSAVWAAGNLRCVIAANPASDLNHTDALKTQSHASGYFIDGSVSFDVFVESPLSWVGEQSRFLIEAIHILRGQLGAPITLHVTAAGTEPTLAGVNGETVDVTGVDGGVFLPYGMTYPGGI